MALASSLDQVATRRQCARIASSPRPSIGSAAPVVIELSSARVLESEELAGPSPSVSSSSSQAQAIDMVRLTRLIDDPTTQFKESHPSRRTGKRLICGSGRALQPQEIPESRYWLLMPKAGKRR